MSIKTRPAVFLIILVIAMLGIVGYRFERYYSAQDYPLYVFTSCDTSVHSCFEADASVADPAFQAEPYAKVEVVARYAPACLEEHTCKDFSCSGLASCTITYCSDDALEDGESCTVPPVPQFFGTSTEELIIPLTAE